MQALFRASRIYRGQVRELIGEMHCGRRRGEVGGPAVIK